MQRGLAAARRECEVPNDRPREKQSGPVAGGRDEEHGAIASGGIRNDGLARPAKSTPGRMNSIGSSPPIQSSNDDPSPDIYGNAADLGTLPVPAPVEAAS